MMGRSRGGMPENFKDENGINLNSDEEVRAAFRNRLMRTFNINDEENDSFCEETERRVERWIDDNRERFTPKETVEYEDTLEIKA